MSAHATMFCLESEVPASINEEDWSADYEISPMPTATFHHLLQQQGQPRSSTPSSPPSLCTGSTARSSRVDMYTHGAASSSSSSSQVSSSRPADQAIEIFLDRPACAYTAVLAWLRSGRLPRSYNLTSTLDLFAEKLQDGRLELRNATSLPASQLALSLHPLISSLQDLMEESKWLGLKDLSEECEDRINELASWLRHQSRAEYTECQRNQDLRPRSQHFKRERRPRQARFYGSNVPPYTSLPHATPEDQRQGWI